MGYGASAGLEDSKQSKMGLKIGTGIALSSGNFL